MTAIEQARSEHWRVITKQAESLRSLWWKYLDGPYIGADTGYIVDDAYFESVDRLVVSSLLSHLKSEFSEFESIADWKGLFGVNLSSTQLSKLDLISHRGTFQGTCAICEHWQESQSAKPALMTLQLMQAYLEPHKSSPSTYQMYFSILSRFAKAYEFLPIEPEPIEDFLSQFKGDTTRLSYYKALRWFYKWCERRYEVTNPIDKVRAPRARKKVVPSLSREEVGRLLNQKFSKRDRTILQLLVGCGLRVGEASRLTFEDISKDTLKVPVTGKTGERVVPLRHDIRDALLALRDGHKLDAPIFWGTHPTQPLKTAGFEQVVKKAFEGAGIQGKRSSPHTLRHTFARSWITNGGDVISLQKILGHASLEETQKYVSLVTDDLVSKNQKFNPLLSVTQDISPADDSISPTDDSISPADQSLSPADDRQTL